jgi:hypothetical protein
MLDLSPHAMRLTHLAVTRGTIHAGANVWLVREKNVRRVFNPIDAHPGRLLPALSYRGKLLHLWTIRLDRLVTRHASRDVRDRRIARLIRVLVTETTFELRAFFFRYVLPVIELDRLCGRFNSAEGPKQDEPAYEHQHGQKHKDLSQSSHEVSPRPIRQSWTYLQARITTAFRESSA